MQQRFASKRKLDALLQASMPRTSVMPAHQELALFLPRALVREALGDDVDALGGRRLPTHGIGGLLAGFMQALATEAPLLGDAERMVALRAAANLALAALDTKGASAAALERQPDDLYVAALRLIAAHCANPELSPNHLSAALGISRATLYRPFAHYGEGVSRAIWAARLDLAHRLLNQQGPPLPISEVAYRSGFLDPSSFARMYRKRFGCSPRQTGRG